MKTIQFLRSHVHSGKSYQLRETMEVEDATADKLVMKGFAKFYEIVKVKKTVIMDEQPIITKVPVDETVVLSKISKEEIKKEEKSSLFSFKKKKSNKNKIKSGL